MSILDINMKVQKKHLRKTIIIYLLCSALAIGVGKIYGAFGHGVHSDAMTWMFLFPLLGGVIFYLAINIFSDRVTTFSGYRLFYNIYNSGIATLTIRGFLKGILEIAGTSSNYLVLFNVFGAGLITLGLIMMFIMLVFYPR